MYAYMRWRHAYLQWNFYTVYKRQLSWHSPADTQYTRKVAPGNIICCYLKTQISDKIQPGWISFGINPRSGVTQLHAQIIANNIFEKIARTKYFKQIYREPVRYGEIFTSAQLRYLLCSFLLPSFNTKCKIFQELLSIKGHFRVLYGTACLDLARRISPHRKEERLRLVKNVWKGKLAMQEKMYGIIFVYMYCGIL